MYQVLCPGCKGVIRVPESAMGAAGRCPDCGQSFYVPAPVVDNSAPAPQEFVQLPADLSTHDPASGSPVRRAAPEIFALQAEDEQATGPRRQRRKSSGRRRETPPGMAPIPPGKRLAGGLFCFGMAVLELAISLAMYAYKPRPRYLVLGVIGLLAFTVWGVVLLCTRYEDVEAARQARLRNRRQLRGMGQGLKFAWPWFVGLGAVWGLTALLCWFHHGQGLAVYGIVLAGFLPMLVGTAWFYIVAKWDEAPVLLTPGVIWSPERRMLVADYLAENPRRAGVPLWVGGFGGLLFLLTFPLVRFAERTGAAPPPHVQGGGVENLSKPAQPAAPRPRAGEPPAATRFPGLLGYWNLDEAEGEKAADSSGRAGPATLANARRIPGVRGKAVQLSGKDSYLDYGSSPLFNFAASAPFTFAGWVRATRADGTVLSQRNSRSPAPVIDLTIEGGRLCGLVRQDGFEAAQAARVASGSLVNDGEWHHFALTRDGSGQVELFVDGISQARATGGASGGAITTDWRTVGLERYWVQSGRLFGTPDFNGAIDECCVFDQVLKPEEIQGLAGR